MTDTMRDVTHTPPNDTRNWVQRHYERGPDAVTDGGREAERDVEPDATEETTDDDEEVQTLKDVDHTPKEGDGVNHVYRRGTRRE